MIPAPEQSNSKYKGVLGTRHGGKANITTREYCRYYVTRPERLVNVMCGGHGALWPVCPDIDRCSENPFKIQMSKTDKIMMEQVLASQHQDFVNKFKKKNPSQSKGK